MVVSFARNECFERDPIPNDATTRERVKCLLHFLRRGAKAAPAGGHSWDVLHNCLISFRFQIPLVLKGADPLISTARRQSPTLASSGTRSNRCGPNNGKNSRVANSKGRSRPCFADHRQSLDAGISRIQPSDYYFDHGVWFQSNFESCRNSPKLPFSLPGGWNMAWLSSPPQWGARCGSRRIKLPPNCRCCSTWKIWSNSRKLTPRADGLMPAALRQYRAQKAPHLCCRVHHSRGCGARPAGLGGIFPRPYPVHDGHYG